MKRLLVLSLMLLAACGTRYMWVKKVSQDELNRDRYECERDARMSAGSFGTGLVGAANAEDFIGRCFQAKGYVLKQVTESGMDPEWQESQRSGCRKSCAANNLGQACYDACARSYR